MDSKHKFTYDEFVEKYLEDNNLGEDEITERQWKILNAAVKVFSEKGYGSSRTSEIAKEADVAEGTIFRYYKTKKDLLMGLIIPFITKFFRPLVFASIERIMRNTGDKSIDEILKEVISDRIELVRKNMPIIKTIFIEASYQPELLEAFKNEIKNKFIPVTSNFIESYIEKEQIRDIEPMVVIRSLISTVGGYIALASTFPEYFSGEGDQKETDKLVDILLNGIKKK